MAKQGVCVSKPRKLSKQLILNRAADMLNSGQQLSFTTLSKQFGTHSQALYPYFKNREELLNELFAWVLRQLLAAMQQANKSDDSGKAIVAVAVQFRKVALTNFGLFKTIMAISPTAQKVPEVQGLIREIRTSVDGALVGITSDQADRLLLSRAIRNIMIGEIFNEGSGWFDDPRIPAGDSYQRMLNDLITMYQDRHA